MPRTIRIILFCLGISLVFGFASSWLFSETNYYLPGNNGPKKISKEGFDHEQSYGSVSYAYSEENFSVQLGLVVSGIALGASFLVSSIVFRKSTNQGAGSS